MRIEHGQTEHFHIQVAQSQEGGFHTRPSFFHIPAPYCVVIIVKAFCSIAPFSTR